MKWKSWGLALYQYVTTPINIKYKWAWGVQSNNNLTTIYKPLHVNVIRNCNVITVVSVNNLGHVRLGSIRNKNNWNNVSKRLFGSYSHSGIPGFPFRLFYPQEQNSWNISGIYSGINSYSGISQMNVPLNYDNEIGKI